MARSKSTRLHASKLTTNLGEGADKRRQAAQAGKTNVVSKLQFEVLEAHAMQSRIGDQLGVALNRRAHEKKKMLAAATEVIGAYQRGQASRQVWEVAHVVAHTAAEAGEKASAQAAAAHTAAGTFKDTQHKAEVLAAEVGRVCLGGGFHFVHRAYLKLILNGSYFDSPQHL